MKRVILVGHGYFGSLYRERIQSSNHLELVGVADTDYNRIRTLEGATIADSYKYLADNVDHDCVIICTPPHLHCELSLEAMLRGKHVLCMKPGGMTPTEANILRDTARERNVIYEVDYTLLNAPEYAYLYDRTMNRKTITSMGFYRNIVGPPKPAGVVLDLFSHDVSLFCSMQPLVMFRELAVTCVADVVSASADIYDKDHKHLAHLSGGYNAPFPMKKMSVWCKPEEEITNPRIEYAWDQNAKSIAITSQGDTLRFQFRHNPDLITISIERFAWALQYELGSSLTFMNVMRLLHAMRHSAENKGRIVKVVA